MTVEELRELLAPMPPLAFVEVRIATNINYAGEREPLEESRGATVDAVNYAYGEVVITLDE